MDLLDLSLPELRQYFSGHGKKPYLAQQVFHWIYQKRCFHPEQWSNISLEDRAFLREHFTLHLPQIVWSGRSRDGTRKFLLRMRDGQTVEAVLIPGGKRLTLCLSTQVGCAIGCTFCHTGTQGLSRHLRSGEIVGQLLAMPDAITNIVYMGMGEPLHNFQAVKQASELFLEPAGLAFGQRRITLSTSGLVPQIQKLDDFPPINIAISLHAAHNEIRSELMPINKRYDLKRLLEAIKSIPLKAHRRITYEYLLIDGLNNRPQDVAALARLLPRRNSKINLIPFNEYPQSRFARPSREKTLWFRNQLCQRGFTCTIRCTMGDDIMAACGQLKTSLPVSRRFHHVHPPSSGHPVHVAKGPQHGPQVSPTGEVIRHQASKQKNPDDQQTKIAGLHGEDQHKGQNAIGK